MCIEFDYFSNPMDTSFLGVNHEYKPRAVFSTTSTDWQDRVNFPRMRAERLAKAKEQMDKFNLGAIVCFVGENIRYLTGVFQGNWKNNIFIRYCVLTRDGEPVLFETAGSDLECAKIDAPWMKDRIRPAITWKWSESAEEWMAGRMAASVYEVIKEAGMENEQIGIDNPDIRAYQELQKLGLNVVNGWPALSAARLVKTRDEIECLKISSAFGDAAMWKAMHEWAKPGAKESYVCAKVNEFLYESGFDFVYDIIVASGGNTSPYRRWHTDKIIRQGDLMIIDINAIGPGGYFIDFVRCWKVAAKPTQKEKDLYKECHDSLYAAIEMFKPGATTKEVAERFPYYADDQYKTVTLQQFAHSIGLTLYEGMWVSRAFSLDYPMEIKQNMTFAVETFAGHPNLEQTVRLEENIVVTDKGYELLTRCEIGEDIFADGCQLY